VKGPKVLLEYWVQEGEGHVIQQLVLLVGANHFRKRGIKNSKTEKQMKGVNLIRRKCRGISGNLPKLRRPIAAVGPDSDQTMR
jgi:hypothetical protein